MVRRFTTEAQRTQRTQRKTTENNVGCGAALCPLCPLCLCGESSENRRVRRRVCLLHDLHPASCPRGSHDRLAPGPDDIEEVGPHRPVAGDVAEAGEAEPAVLAAEGEVDAVRLEGR